MYAGRETNDPPAMSMWTAQPTANHYMRLSTDGPWISPEHGRVLLLAQQASTAYTAKAPLLLKQWHSELPDILNYILANRAAEDQSPADGRFAAAHRTFDSIQQNHSPDPRGRLAKSAPGVAGEQGVAGH